MSQTLSYKDYYATIQISFEDNLLHGKIECIRDLVTFEAETPAELQKEFEAAVDDYLETCEMLGKSPDKTYSGQFNVRIPQENHKQLVIRAIKSGVKLNAVVTDAINNYLSDKKVAFVVNTESLNFNERPYKLETLNTWQEMTSNQMFSISQTVVQH